MTILFICGRTADTINKKFSGGTMLNSTGISADKKPNFDGQVILVAEDTEINKEIIKAFLQNTKVKIEFASNGIEAVDMFKADPGKYALILMDVQMPKMDGLKAASALRALGLERAKTIPIIALTANVLDEDIRECLDAGMDGHIGKPIDMDRMFATLMAYMKETPLGNTGNKAGGSGGYSHFLPYINVQDGLGRLMNDKKLYFKILGSFDGKKFSGDLLENINSGNFKAAAVSAHTLKGVAANLGLTALFELSKEIEMKAKGEEDIAHYAGDIVKTVNKTLDLISELTKN